QAEKFIANAQSKRMQLIQEIVELKRARAGFDQRAELLHEPRAGALQLVDLLDELHALALGVGDDLLRLGLGVRGDDLGLLAGVRLHLVRQPLGRGERLLEQLLALLVIGDAGLAAAQLLVLLVELAVQLLHLGGALLEEEADLALVQSSESHLAERLLLQVERSELHGSEDTPTAELPFRTRVGSVFRPTGGRVVGEAASTPSRRPCFTRYMAA